jgi:pimeloyl-ACP methyl ester carboxylesterase
MVSARDTTECTVVIVADTLGGARHLCATHTRSQRCRHVGLPARSSGGAFPHPEDRAGRSPLLRYLAPPAPPSDKGDWVVLYVHGGTFPSGLSISHRFDGWSWRDELCAAGFHVWALDSHGFGRLSDPYPEMERPAGETSPIGRAADASRQLEQAVRFICERHGVGRLSIIAHSWGTIVTGCSPDAARS